MHTLFRFLDELEANNTKERFDEHRSEYLVLRKEFVLRFKQLVENIQTFDPVSSGIESKSSIFRINRDVRFSKDKSPYKPFFSAIIAPN